MNKSIAIVAGFAVAMSISAGAQAADMFSGKDDGWSEPSGSLKDGPYEMPPVWTGLYIGGFIGGGWGSADITDTFEYMVVDPTAKNTIDLSALIAGVNIGYNVQKGNVVYGIEAGLGTLSFSDEVTDDDLRRTKWDFENVKKIGATYSISGNLYGELTGRLGYAKDNTLLYLKGGGAFVQTDFDTHYEGKTNNPNNDSLYDFSESGTQFGWTLGVGMEYAMSSKLSLKVEYQHFDFGTISSGYFGEYKFDRWDAAIATLDGDAEADLTFDVVKLGINYKLQDDDGRLQ